MLFALFQNFFSTRVTDLRRWEDFLNAQILQCTTRCDSWNYKTRLDFKTKLFWVSSREIFFWLVEMELSVAFLHISNFLLFLSSNFVKEGRKMDIAIENVILKKNNS